MKRRPRRAGQVEALLAAVGLGPKKPTEKVVPGRLHLKKPDGFTLRQVAWKSLTGDPLSRGGHAHRGSVDHPDQNGRTKREGYEAILGGDLSWFNRVAKEGWSRETRRGLLLATRTYIPKERQPVKSHAAGGPGGLPAASTYIAKERQPAKSRAIDAPSEAARILSQYVLDQIKGEAEKHLTDTVIGFRNIGDVSHGLALPKGATIQDVFALRVQPVLKGWPFVVLVDLEDAFGNLPHGAIHEALKEIGLNRRDRQRVLDLVSIRTREPDGTITRSPGKGISQGNPLSPLVFNMTFGLLLRRVTVGSSWWSFSYGDDLVLLARDYEEALAAFTKFKVEATKLGFRVRELVTTDTIPVGKGTRLYDTRAQAVPLIKIFRVSTTGIALTPKHTQMLEEELMARGIKNITGARRASTYKSVSKCFLRSLLGRDDEDLTPDHGPLRSTVGEETPSSSLTASGSGRSTPQGGGDPVSNPVVREASSTPYGTDDTGIRSPPSPVGPLPERSPVVAVSLLGAHPSEGGSFTDLGRTATAPGESLGFHANGKVPEGGVSNATVVGAENPVTGEEGTGASHRPTTDDAPVPRSVRQLAPEDLDALRAGRRLKVGDHYRGKVLDLAFLGELDVRLRGEAFRQCLRVGSHHGVTRLMVPPGASWIAEYELAGRPHVEGWRLCHRVYDQGMLHLTFRRGVPELVTTKRRGPPPAADLVIERVRADKDTRDIYRIVYRRDGVRGVTSETVKGVLRPATALLAVAKLVVAMAPTRVVLPATRGWSGYLVDERTDAKRTTGDKPTMRAAHVALFDAIKMLRGWQWTSDRRRGDWLVGVRTGLSSLSS